MLGCYTYVCNAAFIASWCGVNAHGFLALVYTTLILSEYKVRRYGFDYSLLKPIIIIV